MCEPTLIGLATFALGAAASGAKHKAKQQLADATEARQKLQEKLAKEKLDRDLELNKQKEILKGESRRRELGKVSRDAERKRATSQVVMGESGISGQVTDAMIMSIMSEEAGIFELSRRQADMNRLEAFNTAGLLGQQWRMDVAEIRQPITRPTKTGLALGVGAAGLSGLGMYSQVGGMFGSPETATIPSSELPGGTDLYRGSNNVLPS